MTSTMPQHNTARQGLRLGWMLLVVICMSVLASEVGLHEHLVMADVELNLNSETDLDGNEKTEKDLEPDHDKLPHQLAKVSWYGSLRASSWYNRNACAVQPLNPPPTPPPERA